MDCDGDESLTPPASPVYYAAVEQDAKRLFRRLSSCGVDVGSVEDEMKAEKANNIVSIAGMKVLNMEQLLLMQSSTIEEVQQLVPLSSTELRLRMGKFRWDMDAFVERYFDCEGAFDKEKIVVSDLENITADKKSSPKGALANASQMACQICFCDDDLAAMKCGHICCLPCWRQYVCSRVMEHSSSERIDCPVPDCSVMLEDAAVLRLLETVADTADQLAPVDTSPDAVVTPDVAVTPSDLVSSLTSSSATVDGTMSTAPAGATTTSSVSGSPPLESSLGTTNGEVAAASGTQLVGGSGVLGSSEEALALASVAPGAEWAASSVGAEGEAVVVVEREGAGAGMGRRCVLRFQKLMINSFVMSNRCLMWCPGRDCNYAAVLPHGASSRPRLAHCSVCSTSFCTSCGETWHEPVSCAILRRWLARLASDSGSFAWMLVNTKPCPKCHVKIEKNGGCNHMTCQNANCGYNFCWICLGDWANHNNCTDIVIDDKDDMGRFFVYHRFYINHFDSLNLEAKLRVSIQNRIKEFCKSGISRLDVAFLENLFDVLCKCRTTLMYTYVFAYYLEKNNHCVIFESNQNDLEKEVEALSYFLERDFKANKLKFIRQSMQDKGKHCDRRRQNLIDHVNEGFENDCWTYRLV